MFNVTILFMVTLLKILLCLHYIAFPRICQQSAKKECEYTFCLPNAPLQKTNIAQKSDKHFTETAVNMLALMYFIIFR